MAFWYVFQVAGGPFLSSVQGIYALNLETLASNRLKTPTGAPYMATLRGEPRFSVH